MGNEEMETVLVASLCPIEISASLHALASHEHIISATKHLLCDTRMLHIYLWSNLRRSSTLLQGGQLCVV